MLAIHPENGSFAVADDLGDNSAADQGHLIEIERHLDQSADNRLTGTIAEDWLIGLGFDKKADRQGDQAGLSARVYWSSVGPAATPR